MESSFWIEIYDCNGETVDMVKVKNSTRDTILATAAFQKWCAENSVRTSDYGWDFSTWEDDDDQE